MKRMIAAALAALMLAAAAHAADPYPSRAIRLVVGFPPGGGADSIARLLADHMGRTLGQPVVIENRPGADTTIAPAVVAAAPADGYTLLLAPEAIYGADRALYPATVKYDEGSFTPVNRVASTFFVLAANKDAGIRRWADLAAKGRESQAPLFLASPGGSYLQIIAADLKRLSGLNLEEVPYKGGAPATVAVISGEALLTLMGPGALLPLVREGKIVAVASTNAARSALVPDLPTLDEEGLGGFSMSFWYGLAGPAGMPQDVVRKLFDASTQALADPAVRQKLAALGYEPAPAASPGEFRASAMRDGATLRTRVLALPRK
jgi:tripartite-type tricarboxylate transporter receptor subunit TctC